MSTVYRKDDRVRYQVLHNDGQGFGVAHTVKRPAFGRVTSTYEHPQRGTMVRIAVESPDAGSARYVERAAAEVETDGTWLRTAPDRFNGTWLEVRRLDDGQLRAGLNYPISIGGKRTEHREVSTVLSRDDRDGLAAFLAAQLGYVPADAGTDDRGPDFEYSY